MTACFVQYMKQIREKEDERDGWTTPLVGRELQQFDSNLSHMAMLARFHNAAAVDTTHTLALLTSRCADLFCHSIMVDRISAMLNYFLLKLVSSSNFLSKLPNCASSPCVLLDQQIKTMLCKLP